jgi:hypothetical protein
MLWKDFENSEPFQLDLGFQNLSKNLSQPDSPLWASLPAYSEASQLRQLIEDWLPQSVPACPDIIFKPNEST